MPIFMRMTMRYYFKMMSLKVVKQVDVPLSKHIKTNIERRTALSKWRNKLNLRQGWMVSLDIIMNSEGNELVLRRRRG